MSASVLSVNATKWSNQYSCNWSTAQVLVNTRETQYRISELSLLEISLWTGKRRLWVWFRIYKFWMYSSGAALCRKCYYSERIMVVFAGSQKTKVKKGHFTLALFLTVFLWASAVFYWFTGIGGLLLWPTTERFLNGFWETHCLC